MLNIMGETVGLIRQRRLEFVKREESYSMTQCEDSQQMVKKVLHDKVQQ